MHIIFGWKDASKRALRLRKKGELYYSESNYNLYWPPNEPLKLWQIVWILRGHPFAIKKGEVPSDGDMQEEPLSNTCEECSTRTNLPCALYQNPGASFSADLSYREIVDHTLWPVSSTSERVFRQAACEVTQTLLGFTETDAEKRFYELYSDRVFYDWRKHGVEERILSQGYSDPSAIASRYLMGALDVGSENWFQAARADLQRMWEVPALIPQVVLNFVIPSDLPEDHPDKKFYESNEGRVDFVFFDNQGKHIVQIDGPYHYRSDEEYTRRLRRDRTMRKQGWHVHRFSNKEVMEAEDFTDFDWELFG